MYIYNIHLTMYIHFCSPSETSWRILGRGWRAGVGRADTVLRAWQQVSARWLSLILGEDRLCSVLQGVAGCCRVLKLSLGRNRG